MFRRSSPVLRLAALRIARDPVALTLSVATAPGFALAYAAMPGAPKGYLASLLVFSVLMAQFGASISATRERETGTLALLLRTPQSKLVLGGGLLLPHLAPAFASHALTLVVAGLTGALQGEDASKLARVLLTCLAGSTASAGVGLSVASFARTLIHAFLVTSLLMFLQLLCAGLLFPAPDLAWVGFLPTHSLRLVLLAELGMGPSTELDSLARLVLHAVLWPLLGAALLLRTTSGSSSGRA
jgi:hypothetical protein